MKNKLLLLSLALGTQFYAQTGFKLYHKSTSALLVANQVIQMTTIAEDVVKYTVDIHNTSSSTKKYIVKRYDMLLNAQAVANFCFAGACYTADKTQSPDSLTLGAGKKASELDAQIPNSTLDIDLTEYGQTIGKSIVRYTIFDAFNLADSAQLVVSYNGAIAPSGLKESENRNITSMNFFPNPAKDNTVLKINALKSETVELSVYNMLGDVVYTEKVNVAVGENEIKLDVKGYANGVYFVNLPSGTSILTKKLVVN